MKSSKTSIIFNQKFSINNFEEFDDRARQHVNDQSWTESWLLTKMIEQ